MTASESDSSVFRDPLAARRALQQLARQGVSDDDLQPLAPGLLAAVRDSPDPDRALVTFSRWFAGVCSPYSHLQTLLRHPVALHIFCLVAGSSQYLGDLLVRNPEYFEILSNPGVRGGVKSASALHQEVGALIGACRQPELMRDVLRRWKAREMLRIAVRDLTGLASMPATARSFSHLADACVQAALEIALRTLPLAESEPAPLFAVIGMGKLGGVELNYSSDIDLIFVTGDELPERVTAADGRRLEAVVYLGRLAECLIKTLADDTPSGHVFRVDMRLRPEGRFGPLVRSLASCRAYYENWAESWERQALLKARPVAGDPLLGAAFVEAVTPFVYPRTLPATIAAEIRANKRQIEDKCAVENETLTNIKTGWGGIRDVEFTVQLLQLRGGGRLPRLRSTNTLSALQRLRHADILPPAEAARIAEDYQWLRTLEHRLQLLHGFQTQVMPPPTEPHERLALARRMGYGDLVSWERDLDAVRLRVRAFLNARFYVSAEHEAAAPRAPADEWSDAVRLLRAADAPAAVADLLALLGSAGFRRPQDALGVLRMSLGGNEFGGMPPDTPVRFSRLFPEMMRECLRSADPDAALAGIEALALAVPNRAELYASLTDSPDALSKLVQLSAEAPPLVRRLAGHLEWMEILLSEDEASSLGDAGELDSRLQGANGREAKLRTLARFHQREILRIGAHEIWGLFPSGGSVCALSRLADLLLDALLRLGAEEIAAESACPQSAAQALSRVAVVGLGKLGGEETGYASDWDVVFAYDPPRTAPGRETPGFALANALVERVLLLAGALNPLGSPLELDLRLRPWGRKGALVFMPRDMARYYGESGETWERQAAIKARFCAGNAHVGGRMVRVMRAVSFGKGISAEEADEVRAMKRRIESERLRPGDEERDLKLGHGGLTDIEWLAQLAQLQRARVVPPLRTSHTIAALDAMAASRLLDAAEADTLRSAYLLLTRIRNAMWLRTGQPSDTLPDSPIEQAVLDAVFAYRLRPGEQEVRHIREEVNLVMREVRRIFIARFYEGQGYA